MTTVRALAHALWSLRGTPDGVRRPTEPGVSYRRDRPRGIAPLADIYLPERPAGASVVLVHGGAFVIGSREMKPMRFLAARFAAAGLAVCAIDYRLVFRGGRLDEATEDVAAAVGYWTDRTVGLGLDPRAISLLGLSAGGTLAMLAATRPEACNLHRLGCAFGLYELDTLEGAIANVLPRLILRTSDRARWRMRSPRAAVQPAIPTLLLHGTADGLVPVAQAERLAAHREALGLPTRLVVYPDAAHGFFNVPGATAEAAVHELITHFAA